MSEIPPVWKEQRLVESFEVDMNGRLKRIEDLLGELREEERGASDEELRVLKAEASELEKSMRKLGNGMMDCEDRVKSLTEEIRELESKALAEAKEARQPPQKAEARAQPEARPAPQRKGLFGGLFGRLRGKKGD